MTDPIPPADRPDPVVARVNELVTTAFDAAATLLFAVGAWVFTRDHLDGALAWVAAALVVTVFSLLAQRRAAPRRVKRPPVAEPALPPGPSDPGNVHMSGW